MNNRIRERIIELAARIHTRRADRDKLIAELAQLENEFDLLVVRPDARLGSGRFEAIAPGQREHRPPEPNAEDALEVGADDVIGSLP